MAEIQSPDKDITQRTEAGATIIDVKSRSALRTFIGNLALGPTVVVGGLLICFGIFIGVMADGFVGTIAFFLGIGVIALGCYALIWSDRSVKMTSVRVTRQGLEKDGKMYLMSDIDALNSHHSGGDIINPNNSRTPGMEAEKIMRERAVSGQVSIIFGGQEVAMFDNLLDHQVERVGKALSDAMEANGYVFRPAEP